MDNYTLKEDNNDSEYKLMSQDYPNYDKTYNIILLGDQNVGKSYLLKSATKRSFDDTYSSTNGMDTLSFYIRFREKIIRLEIYDTCGLYIYKSLISSHYKKCSLGIIVYAIDK